MPFPDRVYVCACVVGGMSEHVRLRALYLRVPECYRVHFVLMSMSERILLQTDVFLMCVLAESDQHQPVQ